ncbi:family 20 glycosylhydrolase [Curtobacterium flaccumfaciens]|nr:family 20 glycosylhydrolase [Curtobacterium flaccumfaciens]
MPKTQWREDPDVQTRIRQLGLRDEGQLQAWIIGRLAEHLASSGRRAFGWDEILEGSNLPQDATVISWRGNRGAITAVRRGHDVISAADDPAYLDYRQSDDDSEPIPMGVVNGVAEVFAFDPVPEGLDTGQRAHVIGGQGNLWSEHLDTVRMHDYMLFPRLAALAEALWSADTTGPRDLADFELRLTEHLERLAAMGIEYRPPPGPLPWQTRPGIPGRAYTRAARSARIAALTANITD